MKIKFAFSIFFILLIIAGLPGCTKDDTTVDPELEAFLGTWNVTQKKLSYEVTITVDEETYNGVLIRNFALIGESYPPAKATVSGSTITLDPGQVIGSGLTVNGSGILSGNKITWDYTTFDGADLTNVHEVYTRQ